MASFVWLHWIFTHHPITVYRIESHLQNRLKSIRLYVCRFDGLFFNLQSYVHQWYICSIQYFIRYFWRCTQSQFIICWRQFKQRFDTIRQSFDIINIDSNLSTALYNNRNYTWCNYFINNNRKYSRYCCGYSRKKSSFSCLLSFCIISCCRFNGSFHGKSLIC